MHPEKILLTGAGGQIGTVLTAELRRFFGETNVVSTDIRPLSSDHGPTEILDVLDGNALHETCKRHGITQIYHLAAILSAKGEQMPMQAWKINMDSLFNVLETARGLAMRKVYFPSSIAVFGAESKRVGTPQFGPLIPATVYGISKAAGENWSLYYFKKYGLDVRSLRYPGIVGWQSKAGGGTTDYAVDIYDFAVRGQKFICFLKKNTRLPMIYMDDAIRGTIELMEAEASKIRVRTSYNLASMSFTPDEIAASIQREIPGFEIGYRADFRQAIADSWPKSIDDSAARKDWGWQPKFDLDSMTRDMILHLNG